MNENPDKQFDNLPEPYAYLVSLVQEIVDKSWIELRDRALSPSVGRYRQMMRSARLSGTEGGQQAIIYAPTPGLSPRTSLPPRVTSLSSTRLLRVRDAAVGNLSVVGTSDGDILFLRRDQPRDNVLNNNGEVITSSSLSSESLALKIQAFRQLKQGEDTRKPLLPMLSVSAFEAAKLRLSSISISSSSVEALDEKGLLLPSSLKLSSSLHQQPLSQSSSIVLTGEQSNDEKEKASLQQTWKDTLYFAGGVTVLPETTSVPAPDYFRSSSNPAIASTSSSVVGFTHSAVNTRVGFEEGSATNSERETIARRLGLSWSVTYALPIWSKREELRGFLVASAGVAVATSEKKATALSASMANETTSKSTVGSKSSSTIPASSTPSLSNQSKPPTKGGVATTGASSSSSSLKVSDAALAAEVSDALSRKKPALCPFTPTGVVRLFHVPRQVLATTSLSSRDDDKEGGRRRNKRSDDNPGSRKPTIFSAYDASFIIDVTTDAATGRENGTKQREEASSRSEQGGERKYDSKFDNEYDEEEEEENVAFERAETHEQSLLPSTDDDGAKDSSPFPRKASSYVPPVRWVASATLPLGVLAAKVEVSIDGRFLSVLCSDAHVRVYYIHPAAMTPPPPEPPRESDSAALIRIAAEMAHKEDQEEEERKNSPSKVKLEQRSYETVSSRIAKYGGPITFPPLPLPPPLELELVSDLSPPTLDSIFSSLSSSFSSSSSSASLSRSAAALAAAGGARIAPLQSKDSLSSPSTSTVAVPLLVGFHFTASRSYSPDANEENVPIDYTRTVGDSGGAGSVAMTSRTRGGQGSQQNSSSSFNGTKSSSTRAKSSSSRSPITSDSSPSSSSTSSPRLPKNSPGHDGIPVTDGCIVWWTVDKSAPGGSQARAAQDNLRCVFRFPLNLKTLIDSPPPSPLSSSSSLSSQSSRKASDMSNTLFTPLPFAPTSSCIFPNVSSYHHISANASGMFPSASSPLLILGDDGGTVSAFELGAPTSSSRTVKASPTSSSVSFMQTVSSLAMMSPGALISRGILGRHTLFPSLQASLSADAKNHQLLNNRALVTNESEGKEEKTNDATSSSSSLSSSLPNPATAATVTALAISACCCYAVSGSASGQVFIYDLRQALMALDDGVVSRPYSDPLLSFPSSSSSSSLSSTGNVSSSGLKSSFSSKVSGLGLVGGSLLASLSHNSQSGGGGGGGWQTESSSSSEVGVVLKLPCHVLAARWDGNGVVSSLRMLLDVPVAIAEVEEWPTCKRGEFLLPDETGTSIQTSSALYAYDVPAGSLLTVLRPSDKVNTTALSNGAFGGMSGSVVRDAHLRLSTVKPLEPDGLALKLESSNGELVKGNSKEAIKVSADAVVSQGDVNTGALRNVFIAPLVSPSNSSKLTAELAPSLAQYALWSVSPDGVLLSSTSIASNSNNNHASDTRDTTRTFVHSVTLRGLLRSGYPVLDRAFLRAGLVAPVQRAGSARSSQPNTQGAGSSGGNVSRLEDVSPTEAILRSAFAAQLYAALSFNDRSLGRNVASSILAGPDAQAITSRLVDQRAIALLESRGGGLGGGGGGDHSQSVSSFRQNLTANASGSLLEGASGSLSPPPLGMHNVQGDDDEGDLSLDDDAREAAVSTSFSTNTNEISRTYMEERSRTFETRDFRLSVRAKTTAKLLGRESHR